MKVEWKERETYLKWRFDNDTGGINPGGGWTKGEGVIVSLEQNAKAASSHHYCLVINSDGKSPETLEAYAKAVAVNPGYTVLKQDKTAHVVAFGTEDGRDLYSYTVFEPDSAIELFGIVSANTRVNIMMQKNRSGDLVISICDPYIGLGETKGQGLGDENMSPARRVAVTFSKPIRLISSTSGLPQANPPLDARVIGEGNKTLSYNTANGVTDTFTISIQE